MVFPMVSHKTHPAPATSGAKQQGSEGVRGLWASWPWPKSCPSPGKSQGKNMSMGWLKGKSEPETIEFPTSMGFSTFFFPETNQLNMGIVDFPMTNGNFCILVGGILTSLKHMKFNWGEWWLFPRYGKIKHVPKHQHWWVFCGLNLKHVGL